MGPASTPNATSEPGAPEPLGYATAPPEPADGVRVSRDAFHVEVIVPPVPGWRALPPGFKWSIGGLIVIIVWQVAVSQLRREALGGILFHVIVLAAVVAFGFVRLRRWLRFVVTAERFFLMRRLAGMGETVTSWPRDHVLAATVSGGGGETGGGGGTLVLRILGQDTLELFVSTDREAARRVAQTLEAALHEPFMTVAAVTGETSADAQRAPAAAEAAAAAVSPRGRRFAMVGVYAVIATLVVLFYFAPVAGAIVLAVAVIAAIPLGMRYGTQEKDYWP
jgi:hypothetical protein